MTASRDPNRLIHAFLREGLDELPDPVYDAVRDHIEETRQRVVIGPWRTPDVNRYLKLGLAAAAAVVIAVAGYQLLGDRNVGTPTPTATAESTATPAVTPEPIAAGLPLGPFTLTRAGGIWDIGMTVTIAAADWNGSSGDGVLVNSDNADPPDGAGLIVFTGQLEVYGDPCHWQTTRPDPMTGATVQDVIEALQAQSGRNATQGALDTTVDGYSATLIRLSVPTDANFALCDRGQFRSWGPEETSRYHQGPGQIDWVWVVDVDGTLVTIDAALYEGTPERVLNELTAIVDSIRFELP